MILAQFHKILRVSWHFRPIPLRKIVSLNLTAQKNLLLEGLLGKYTSGHLQ